jgi:hypothetical protein
MSLASSISRIFLRSPKPMFLSSSKIRREIFGFRKKLFWELIPSVEVILVSKFHPIWCPITQESSLRRGRFWVKIMFLETYYRTMFEIPE